MNTDNQTLRLSLAAFAAIVIHTFIIILIHWFEIPLIEIREKTIPFKLISPSSNAATTQTSSLSPADNARAAQEYLRTLNQSQFKQATERDNKTAPFSNRVKPSPLAQKNQAQQRTAQSNAINDLQGIFSRETPNVKTTSVKQISNKELEQLSDYEVLLLKALAKESLYDRFHEVMNANKRKEVRYSITLNLFPNGAIKNASIREPSGLAAIDELAIQAAYLASPFPMPPRDDIQRGYKYHIPIIYKKKNNQ